MVLPRDVISAFFTGEQTRKMSNNFSNYLRIFLMTFLVMDHVFQKSTGQRQKMSLFTKKVMVGLVKT